MIPQIVDGPWLVRNTVPSKPALIGHQLKNKYFISDNYMGLDIDVASNTLSNKLTKLSIGLSTKLIVNLSFVLEGRDSNELPEEIVGISSVIYADVANSATPITPI